MAGIGSPYVERSLLLREDIDRPSKIRHDLVLQRPMPSRSLRSYRFETTCYPSSPLFTVSATTLRATSRSNCRSAAFVAAG